MARRKKGNIRRRKKSCALCGTTHKDAELTTHHVFHGKRFKPISDRYGFVITLCSECHKRLHGSREWDKKVQKRCQRAFEQKYGRDEFIYIFGKSWLTEEDDRLWEEELYLRRAANLMTKELENLHLE